MIIVGCNVAKTQYGMKLNDGGAAILVDGKLVCAINEERLSRRKHDAGFKLSLPYILKKANTKIEDVDYFVVSSCSEKKLNPDDPVYVSADSDETLTDLGVPKEKIIVCDHHMSHACTAYFLSPFQDAVIIIADGEGNVIGPMNQEEGTIDIMADDGSLIGRKKGIKYWENLLYRNSQYIGSGNELQLLHVDHVPPEHTGLGELYRYFTTFLGFGAYVNAGKIMGLSSYGTGAPFKGVKLIDFNEHTGEAKTLFSQNYENPIKPILDFLKKEHDIDVKHRLPNSEITKTDEECAYLVQRELNDAMLKKVRFWVNRTKCKNVCIAGGVGLNSVANGHLVKNLDINLFIPSAPGDSGECLGNALYGAMLHGEKIERKELYTPFLGREYSDEEIKNAIQETGMQDIATTHGDEELLEETAKLIQKGHIVGWFQGESEFGPRALGHRSILANPMIPDMKDIINAKVKFRESFRPYAPSVPADDAKTYFSSFAPSPYMSFVADVLDSAKERIPAVTHVDGTARLQTVTRDINNRYYSLIKKFGEQAGIPVILNTSFNIAGEPIVETPVDAINTFNRCGMTSLVLGNTLLVKPE